MPKKKIRYSVYLPVKIAPEDAVVLEETAQNLQVSRCQVLRDLIHSLNMPQKPEAPRAA